MGREAATAAVATLAVHVAVKAASAATVAQGGSEEPATLEETG